MMELDEAIKHDENVAKEKIGIMVVSDVPSSTRVWRNGLKSCKCTGRNIVVDLLIVLVYNKGRVVSIPSI